MQSRMRSVIADASNTMIPQMHAAYSAYYQHMCLRGMCKNVFVDII